MLTKSAKNSRGFTLVELLIFFAIYSVIIVMLTGIFVAIIDSQLQSEATSDVQADINYISSRLSYDISQAEITSPITIGQPANNLQLAVNGINYTYALNQDNLQLTDPTNGSDNLNSYNTRLSDFQVKRLGNVGGKNALQISFTISSKTVNNGQAEIKNYQNTFGVR